MIWRDTALIEYSLLECVENRKYIYSPIWGYPGKDAHHCTIKHVKANKRGSFKRGKLAFSEYDFEDEME